MKIRSHKKNILISKIITVKLGQEGLSRSPGPGSVVQSIVSLTSSLRDQLVKCFTTFITKYTDTCIFIGKMRSFCNAKASHTFSTKNIGVF